MKRIPWLAGLIIPLLLAVGWEAVVRAGLATGRLMPPPSRLVATAAALIRSGELQTHTLATLVRVLLGFGIGGTLGTLMGMLSGRARWRGG